MGDDIDMFAAMDTDRNGYVDPAEASAFSAKLKAGPTGAHAKKQPKDPSSPAARDPAELAESFFIKADKNKDGELTKEELLPFFEAAAKKSKSGIMPTDQFEFMDADSDGSISREESNAFYTKAIRMAQQQQAPSIQKVPPIQKKEEL